jgi:hypothetical protein
LIFSKVFSELFEEDLERLSSKILEQIKIDIAFDNINNINDEAFLLIAANKEFDERYSQYNANENEKE